METSMEGWKVVEAFVEVSTIFLDLPPFHGLKSSMKASMKASMEVSTAFHDLPPFHASLHGGRPPRLLPWNLDWRSYHQFLEGVWNC